VSALIQQRNEYLAAHGACKAAREAQLDLVRVYINRDHFYSRQFLEVGKAANELRRLTSLTPGSLFKQTLNEFRDTFSHQGRPEESAAIYGLTGPLKVPIAPGAVSLSSDPAALEQWLESHGREGTHPTFT